MTTPTGEASSTIETRLDELTDLFRRRLLDDKAKQRAFDELYEQLEFARSGLVEQYLSPLVRESLGLLDRLRTAADSGDASFYSEAYELFRRRGLEEIVVGDRFDPSAHEAVDTEVADVPGDDGRITRVTRAGYRFMGRVIRPAGVVVATAARAEVTGGDGQAAEEAGRRTADPCDGAGDPAEGGHGG